MSPLGFVFTKVPGPTIELTSSSPPYLSSKDGSLNERR